MTKTGLIEQMASELGVAKTLSAELVNTILEIIMDGVSKDKTVSIQGFGVFKVSHIKAREGVNPQNPKEKIKIPAMNVVSFKAGSQFKAVVNS